MNFLERHDALNRIEKDAALSHAMLRTLASAFEGIFEVVYNETLKHVEVKPVSKRIYEDEPDDDRKHAKRDYTMYGLHDMTFDIMTMVPRSVFRHPALYVTYKQYNNVINFLEKERFVDGVKELRNATRLGLKEAKDICEYWRGRIGSNLSFEGSDS